MPHAVSRRRLLVVDDQRRVGVVVAEVQTGAAVLLHVQLVQVSPEGLASGLPLRRVVLDLGRDGAAPLAHGVGVVHREVRHLLGDGVALALVRAQRAGGCPALELPCQVPGEIGGVGKARVHAIARVGHPQVRGVSGDEDTALLQLLGHQTAAEPVFLAHQLVAEGLVHAEDGAQGPIAVHRVEVGFVVAQVVVHQPDLAAIDGVDIAAAARVHAEHGPGRRCLQAPDQARRADAGALHALHDLVAHQPDTHRLADGGSSAVTAHQVPRPHAAHRAGVLVPHFDVHPAVVLGEAAHALAVRQGDPGLAPGLRQQDGLQEALVDAVGRLGRGPPAVRAAGVGLARQTPRDVDARDLATDGGGAVGHVVGIVIRQAGRPQRVRHAQPPVQLHAARRHVVALHVRQGVGGLGFDHQAADAPLRQAHRQGDAHRPGAGDQDLGVIHVLQVWVKTLRSSRRTRTASHSGDAPCRCPTPGRCRPWQRRGPPGPGCGTVRRCRPSG